MLSISALLQHENAMVSILQIGRLRHSCSQSRVSKHPYCRVPKKRTCHHLWRGNGALPWAPRLLRQHPALRAPSFCLAMSSLLPCLPASEQTLANRVRKTHCFPPEVYSILQNAFCFCFLNFNLFFQGSIRFAQGRNKVTTGLTTP